MIEAVRAGWRRLRRRLDRGEWLARLLRLELLDGSPPGPGLVLVQIDGLSHRELTRALAAGEMPFVRGLLSRGRYRLHHQYAGVPASTASYQAELFYGVRQAVPGFNFRQGGSGRLVRMIETDAATHVERELESKGGEPLLKGGSAYVDNFLGGAAESHFCPAARGWGRALREANPLAVALLLASHAYGIVRTAVLLAVELVLALVDCMRGLIAGHDLGRELMLVPTRVVITVLLRELATMGARIDLARGLPVVHVNFLGYDEQAHRRGPDSLFAHWSLKGIDDAIARLSRAARRVSRRHYQLWVHSDHGQEATVPYHEACGRGIAEAAAEVFARHRGEAVAYRTNGPWGIQYQRVHWFGGKHVQRLFPIRAAETGEAAGPLTVAALGPVAFISWEGGLSQDERGTLARALIGEAHVPTVLTRGERGTACAWNRHGAFILPRDAAAVLGTEHPYLQDAARDLVALCHHPDAGDLLAWGWSPGGPRLSFAIEHGAHGGAGPVETDAFIVAPSDALPVVSSRPLRARDLRLAVLSFLGRPHAVASPSPAAHRGPSSRVSSG